MFEYELGKFYIFLPLMLNVHIGPHVFNMYSKYTFLINNNKISKMMLLKIVRRPTGISVISVIIFSKVRINFIR